MLQNYLHFLVLLLSLAPSTQVFADEALGTSLLLSEKTWPEQILESVKRTYQYQFAIGSRRIDRLSSGQSNRFSAFENQQLYGLNAGLALQGQWESFWTQGRVQLGRYASFGQRELNTSDYGPSLLELKTSFLLGRSFFSPIQWSPFLVLGAGPTRYQYLIDGENQEFNKTILEYSFGAGLRFKLGPKIHNKLEKMYLNVYWLEYQNIENTDLVSGSTLRLELSVQI
jgi:hypothetical protein